MIVFVSDLHLTDGTSGKTIDTGAFKLFRDRLQDAAYDASKRANGKYQPIDRLDVVLLGDILDVIRSTKWLDGDARPWCEDPVNDQAFQDKVATITAAILRQNAKSLDVLRSLHEPDVFTIPEAIRGRPKSVSRDPEAAGRRPVEVRFHYMVGNHDWFYHLPGHAFDAIRRRIVEAMGLANDPARPFPHEPAESPGLQELFKQHEVFARHGDIYDPFNFEKSRDASSLGDAIVVELLNRFPREVNEQLTGKLTAPCLANLLAGLREMDNVRPLFAIPAWIDGLLTRLRLKAGDQRQIKRVWNSLARKFLRQDFVRRRDTWFPLDVVDKLELAFTFSEGLTIRNISRLLAPWAGNDGLRESFFTHCFAERAFRERAAQFIIYGHTHHHEIIPLDSCPRTGGGVFDRLYLNSGTWRRVHAPARWRRQDNEFQDHYVMTYLMFYRDGERGGRRFESWSGALGDKPAQD